MKYNIGDLVTDANPFQFDRYEVIYIIHTRVLVRSLIKSTLSGVPLEKWVSEDAIEIDIQATRDKKLTQLGIN